jgi:hypothetical protein
MLGNIPQSGNNLTHTFRIRGIYNNWGAVPKNFMQPAEMVPTISFHGEADPTVPVDSSLGIDCVSPPLLYGSRAMHQALVQNGVCADLTVKPGAGHGVYNATNPLKVFRVARASCFFKSIFCNTCANFYSTDSVAAQCTGTNIGIEPTLFSSEVNIYPNPATTYIQVQGISQPQGLICTLYNTMGQVCFTQTNADLIPIQNLANGIYMLAIKKNNQVRYFRLIKE